MYDYLINQINAYIRNNAANDISGDGLNAILKMMLDALGAGMRFYGIATVDTEPEINQYPKFYIAFKPGFYTNFNIANHPKFVSGFAIIYDENGTNTWDMAVKPFQLEDSFLIDASVKDNTFDSNTVFYVKEANKTNSSSSFSIYAKNKNSSTEQLAATYTYNGLLSGYKTHKIETNTAKYTVSVNWDNISLNEQEEFTYEDTKFPVTAYVDSAADEDIAALKKRIELAEYICGGYTIDGAGLFKRELMLGADGYIGDTPDFRQPTTQSQAESTPWSGTNKILFIPTYNDQASGRNVDLLWANFPANNIYYVYLLNNRGSDYTISVRTMDTDGTTVLHSKNYTLETDTIMEIQVIRHSDLNHKLVYKVDNFLFKP